MLKFCYVNIVDGEAMRKTFVVGVICALLAAFTTPKLAQAQIKFDAAAYQALADASSTQTVPVGTSITLANWQQYKQFMPMSMVAAYSQSYGWKVGPGPEYTVVIGPTEAFKMPNGPSKATEKYAR